MKVEILRTLKGSSLWRKGLVFDDAVAPIPGGVLREVKAGAPTVKVLRGEPKAVAEKPIASVEIENEIIAPWGSLPEAEETSQEKFQSTVPEKEESVHTFKCKLCQWEGKTAPALKAHVTRFHKVNADDKG